LLANGAVTAHFGNPPIRSLAGTPVKNRSVPVHSYGSYHFYWLKYEPGI
jgi:hypothetical protein